MRVDPVEYRESRGKECVIEVQGCSMKSENALPHGWLVGSQPSGANLELEKLLV